MKPLKLIREGMINTIEPEERTRITDQGQLNHLYSLKIQEELNEIRNSDHIDLSEFADLLQVVQDFAEVNGFTPRQVEEFRLIKERDKGHYENLVLTNLNPNNPSNAIYFQKSPAKIKYVDNMSRECVVIECAIAAGVDEVNSGTTMVIYRRETDELGYPFVMRDSEFYEKFSPVKEIQNEN